LFAEHVIRITIAHSPTLLCPSEVNRSTLALINAGKKKIHQYVSRVCIAQPGFKDRVLHYPGFTVTMMHSLCSSSLKTTFPFQ